MSHDIFTFVSTLHWLMKCHTDRSFLTLVMSRWKVRRLFALLFRERLRGYQNWQVCQERKPKTQKVSFHMCLCVKVLLESKLLLLPSPCFYCKHDSSYAAIAARRKRRLPRTLCHCIQSLWWLNFCNMPPCSLCHHDIEIFVISSPTSRNLH